jgi:phosphate/sulfate permease
MNGHMIPMWVLYSCAAAMGLGTLAGGKEVVTKVNKLFDAKANPKDGANAQGVSAMLIGGATLSGIPLSTTQVTSMSNLGTTLGKLLEFNRPDSSHLFGEDFMSHLSGLKQHLTDIGSAWVATIPFSMVAGGIVTYLFLSLKNILF